MTCLIKPVLFLLGVFLAFQSYAQDAILKAEREYGFAYQCYMDGNYQTAYEQFAHFAREYPSQDLNLDAEYYAAECLFRMGRYIDASKRYHLLQMEHPRSKLADDALFREAEISFRQGQYEKAQMLFESVLRNYPDGNVAQEAAYRSGEAAFRNEDYKTALKYSRISFEHYPQGTIRDYGFYSIGYVQEKTGRYAEAQQTYEDFIKEFPSSTLVSSALTRIGSCLYQKKEYDKATAWLHALNDSPDPENAADRLFIRAECLYQLGRFTDAETSYKSFVVGYPHHSKIRQAQYSLAWSYLEQKKYSEAIAEFDQLAAGSDRIAEAARFRKGVAQRLNGDISSAKQVFMKMLSSNPKGSYADNAHFELGMLAYSSGSFSSALNHFETVGIEFPESDVLEDSYMMIGETKLKLQKPAEAASAFEAAIQAPGANSANKGNALFRCAYSHFEAKNFTQSIQFFQRFLKEYPKDPRFAEALVWYGEASYKSGRFAEAVQAYANAFDTTQDNKVRQDALYGIGWSHFRMQNFPEAEKSFRQLSQEYRGGIYDVDANVRLADAQAAQKHYEDATKTYRYLLRMYPKSRLAPYAMVRLGWCEHGIGDTPAGIATLKTVLSKYPESEYAAQAQYSVGSLYLLAGDFDAAIPEFTKVVEEFPASPEVAQSKYSIGGCYFNQGKYQLAEQAYRRVITDHPASPLMPDALLGLTKSLKMQDREKDAEDVRRQWMQSQPTGAVVDELAFLEAKKSMTEGDPEKAIATFQRFIQTYPASAHYQEAFLLLGRAYRENGDFEKAKHTLREAISKGPVSTVAVEAKIQLAQIAMDEQERTAAIEAYGALLRDENTSYRRSELFYYRGLAYRSNKELKEAKADFDRARNIPDATPFPALAAIELAILYANEGNVDIAIRDLNRITGAKQNDVGAFAQYTIGKLLADAQRYDEAEKALLRVKILFPGQESWSVKALLLLGKTYESWNQKQKAEKTFRQIIDSYPASSEAFEARSHLERLN
jgi:TolA-binding protein